MWPFTKRPRGPKYDGLIYAVGDVHGRADLLEALIARIDHDCDGAEGELIFLGDYIDRGPDSRACIDVLLNCQDLTSLQPVFLKGNHEATLLEFLGGAAIGPAWADYGAFDMLTSYGVRPPRRKTRDEDWGEVRLALQHALPATHQAFFEGLAVSADRDPYFFAHAGIDPKKPIEEQEERDLLWIRKPFLTYKKRLERFVVHGHSARKSPIIARYSLGIDTGAYSTGRLTAARIDHRGIRLLHTA